MEEGKKSKFQFLKHKIVQSSFKMDDGIEGKNLVISFLPSGQLNRADSTFRLELKMRIKDENEVFACELAAEGLFKFDDSVEKETLDKMFYINAPAILFPYLRAYISTLTTLSGLKPVLLPAMNLTNLAEELKENTTVV